VFSDLTNDALYHTIAWACDLYQRQPSVYQALQRHAMRKDFSWARSVQQYERVYQWAVAQRNPMHCGAQ
jgi:glycogen synthase